jgi:hypothetical protein
VAGLLDNLFSGQGIGGGLLDYLNSPVFQSQAQQPQFPEPDRSMTPTERQMMAMVRPDVLPSFPNQIPAQGAPQPRQPQGEPQASPIAIGNYMMPRMGAASAYDPGPAALPPNAQPTQGQMPQGQMPQMPSQAMPLPPALGGASASGAGFGDRLMAGLQSWANTPTGNIIGGLANGITGLATGQRSDPAGMQQQNLKAQYDSLVPVLGPQKAMLAILNPEAGKTLLQEALTNKEEFKTIKDSLGGERGYWINNREQTMRPADAAGGAGGSGSLGQGPSLLATGVKQYDANLNGDAYLNQFGPEVKAAVNAYIKGDVMPSGNPRQQAIATKAKEIALKYGADMGIPVGDAVYNEKRKYYTELGSNSPNAAGGQAKAFNQGISHLTALADKLEKLDNSNGFGIPMVANAYNSARQGMSTSLSAVSDEAKSLGQTVAGEVGKLFSGSGGGGVHERELTRERFDTAKSPAQLAAALRATIETMQGGLSALEQRRDAVLGPNSNVEFLSAETRKNIEKIQAVIDRLEGKSPAASSAAAPAELPSGWSVKVK